MVSFEALRRPRPDIMGMTTSVDSTEIKARVEAMLSWPVLDGRRYNIDLA